MAWRSQVILTRCTGKREGLYIPSYVRLGQEKTDVTGHSNGDILRRFVYHGQVGRLS